MELVVDLITEVVSRGIRCLIVEFTVFDSIAVVGFMKAVELAEKSTM